MPASLPLWFQRTIREVARTGPVTADRLAAAFDVVIESDKMLIPVVFCPPCTVIVSDALRSAELEQMTLLGVSEAILCRAGQDYTREDVVCLLRGMQLLAA